MSSGESSGRSPKQPPWWLTVFIIPLVIAFITKRYIEGSNPQTQTKVERAEAPRRERPLPPAENVVAGRSSSESGTSSDEGRRMDRVEVPPPDRAASRDDGSFDGSGTGSSGGVESESFEARTAKISLSFDWLTGTLPEKLAEANPSSLTVVVRGRRTVLSNPLIPDARRPASFDDVKVYVLRKGSRLVTVDGKGLTSGSFVDGSGALPLDAEGRLTRDIVMKTSGENCWLRFPVRVPLASEESEIEVRLEPSNAIPLEVRVRCEADLHTERKERSTALHTLTGWLKHTYETKDGDLGVGTTLKTQDEGRHDARGHVNGDGRSLVMTGSERVEGEIAWNARTLKIVLVSRFETDQ